MKIRYNGHFERFLLCQNRERGFEQLADKCLLEEARIESYDSVKAFL